MRLATLGILLLAGIAALWIFLPDITARIVTQRLQAQGLQDVNVKITSISSGGMQVGYLSLMLVDRSWRISAVDTDIGFRLREILGGDVQTIDIGRLALERQDANGNGDYVGVDSVIALLRQSWNERLLATSIRIQDLVIRDLRAVRRIDVNARVRIQRVGEGLSGEIVLGQNEAQRAIQFQWLAARGLHVAMTPLTITDESPAILDLAIDKDQKDEFLTGDVRADLEQLAHWVQPFLPKTAFVNAAGVIDVNVELRALDSDASLRFTMSGTAENIAVADTELTTAKLTIQGVFRQSDNGFDVEVQNGSAGEFRSLLFTDITIDQLRLMPLGMLSAGPGGITFGRGPGTLLELKGLSRSGLSIGGATVAWAGDLAIRQGITTGSITEGSMLEISELDSQHAQLTRGKVDVAGRITVDPQAMQLDLAFSDWRATNISALGVRVDAVSMEINGRYVKDEQGVRVEIGDDNKITAKTLRGDSWRVDRADMAVAGTIDITDGETRWLDNMTSVVFGHARLFDYSAVQGKITWRGAAAYQNGVMDAELLDGTTLDLQDIRSKQFQAATLKWPLQGKIRSDADAIAIMLQPESIVSVTNINVADIEIPDGRFSPLEQEALRLTKDQAQWSVVSGDWSAEVPPFAWDQYPVRLSPTTVSLELAGGQHVPWGIEAHIAADRLETQALEERIVLSSVEASLRVDNKHFSSVVNFSPHQRLTPFHATLNYQVDSEKADIQFRSGFIDLAKANMPLSVFLKPWPYDFDLASGQIRINGEAQWSRIDGELAPRVSMTMDLAEAGGFYREVLFSGLNAQMSLTLLPSVRSLRSAGVHVAQVDFGLSVTNGRALLSFDVSTLGSLPRITMENLVVEILGGRVSSRKIEYDLNRETNVFELEIHELKLEEIVRLQQFEGLKATGRLSGSVTVIVGSDGVRIEQGKIRALSPGGQINYAPAGGTSAIEQAAPRYRRRFPSAQGLPLRCIDRRYSL